MVVASALEDFRRGKLEDTENAKRSSGRALSYLSNTLTVNVKMSESVRFWTCWRFALRDACKREVRVSPGWRAYMMSRAGWTVTVDRRRTHTRSEVARGKYRVPYAGDGGGTIWKRLLSPPLLSLPVPSSPARHHSALRSYMYLPGKVEVGGIMVLAKLFVVGGACIDETRSPASHHVVFPMLS